MGAVQLNLEKIKSKLNAKKMVFVLLFAFVALIAARLNFSSLMGAENQAFTLFQFIAPATGAFLGPVFGTLSIVIAQTANFVLLGKAPSLFSIARIFPLALAALYFGSKKRKFVALIPVACMALFVLHPIGQQAWFYSLYWLIPIAAAFSDRLFLKSLGSTFTAHAIGSIAFLYLLPSVPELWIALIPVVFVERILFALGISVSFVAFNSVLAKLGSIIPSETVSVDKRYVVK